jgi:D-alanyl-D-alanine carboxypeptidase
LFLGTCVASRARAIDAPADRCTLLTAAQVSKIVGKTFDPPTSAVAPRPFANTVQGTDCSYRGRGDALLFRIYLDPSTGDATALFAKLKMFFGPPVAVSGVGDEAYLDAKHALHARKGNVRFYLDLNSAESGSTAGLQQVKALGVEIAGQL